jgi:inhibitor of cysteine peptidase
MITLTLANDGQTIEIKPGDILSLHLDENPTTGYRWQENADYKDVLQLTSSEYVHNPTGMIGGGGQHVFTFSVLKAGTISLLFKNRRDWEDESASAASFTATVKVNALKPGRSRARK